MAATTQIQQAQQQAPAQAQQAPKRTAVQNLGDLLESKKDAIARVLPKHMTAERMTKVALLAAVKTPKLALCEPASFIAAIIACSELGLEPNSPLGHAYLVPFENKAKGKVEVQFIPGYRGLIDLARRSGTISRLEAHVVHASDRFEIAFGLNPRLDHIPTLKGDPGEVIGAYAVAQLRDGSQQLEFMTRRQLDAIRARSKSAHKGPWVTDEEEMQRKTVVRRLVKYLPMSVEMATALGHDESDDSIVDTIDLPPSAALQSRTEQVKALAARQVGGIDSLDLGDSVDEFAADPVPVTAAGAEPAPAS